MWGLKCLPFWNTFFHRQSLVFCLLLFVSLFFYCYVMALSVYLRLLSLHVPRVYFVEYLMYFV